MFFQAQIKSSTTEKRAHSVTELYLHAHHFLYKLDYNSKWNTQEKYPLTSSREEVRLISKGEGQRWKLKLALGFCTRRWHKEVIKVSSGMFSSVFCFSWRCICWDLMVSLCQYKAVVTVPKEKTYFCTCCGDLMALMSLLLHADHGFTLVRCRRGPPAVPGACLRSAREPVVRAPLSEHILF